MKGLESGKDKIQKICDLLKKETLEPARQEAAEIVENARLQAEEILESARKKGEEMIASASEDIEERRRVFHASLQMASRQGIEDLKQKIETTLFDPELADLVKKEMRDPKVIANLLNAFMRMIEEKGIEDEFVAVIPKEIPPRSITSLLAASALEKIEASPVGDFGGGVQVRLKGQRITIDISDAAVRELIARYIRSDLRHLVFSS